ncbi:MAG: hypothetical protein P8Y68_13340 [Anaerolineales bacterium]|jgi:hypothetical protein
MLSEIKSNLGIKIPPKVIGGTAQIALVVSIFLHQFNVAGTDFFQGLLLGYSMVGNLFWLIIQRKNDETH